MWTSWWSAPGPQGLPWLRLWPKMVYEKNHAYFLSNNFDTKRKCRSQGNSDSSSSGHSRHTEGSCVQSLRSRYAILQNKNWPETTILTMIRNASRYRPRGRCRGSCHPRQHVPVLPLGSKHGWRRIRQGTSMGSTSEPHGKVPRVGSIGL